MGKGFKHGAGGGNPLNFKVVGGTSAPASPKANMIWVNTGQPITSWIFSATEPGSPAEGMVWVKTAASSPTAFNALKKNGILVYPNVCYQRIGSAWTAKTAKTCQGSAWKSWTLTVVPNASSYPSTAWKTYTSTTESGFAPTVTVSSTALTVAFSVYKNSGSNRVYIPVDVTGYSKLTVAGSYVAPNNAYGSNFTMHIGMYASTTGTMATGYQNTTTTDNTTVTISERSFDISSLSGIYYFEAHVINNATSSSYTANPQLTLTKVLFE